MKKSPYIRIGLYKTKYILPLIGSGIKTLQHKQISTTSKRLKVFKKNLQCASCGIIGLYFALEKHKSSKSNKFHLNLYAINEKGEEVLMTKDHIKPKSKGGTERMNNLQTMCCKCNSRKGDKYE